MSSRDIKLQKFIAAPAAMVLLGLILTVGWIATLVWFFGISVWAVF